MLKGKQLYMAAREFAEEELMPALDTHEDISEEKKDALSRDASLLGIALLVDVAESLNKIAHKVG